MVPLRDDSVECVSVVFYVEPVADVDRLCRRLGWASPLQSFQDDDWDEFFRELEGAVVVGAVSD